MNAPIARIVDAYTGTVAPIAPPNRYDYDSLPVAYQIIDGLTAERDAAIKRADDAEAERDNLVNFGREVGRLSDYLRHMIADRDEFRDMYLEYRDRHEGAQCRLDEMAAEIRELQTELATARVERDTAIARASL